MNSSCISTANMSNSSVCCAFESKILHQVLPPVLIIEFIFGLTGNILSISMFTFHIESWKSNYIYLANLAMADSIVLFCVLFRADYYRRGQNWIFGDALCRIIFFLLATNRASGIFFLTAVAVDRYMKIVHPLHSINRMKLSYHMRVCVGLWVITVSMTGYMLSTSKLYYFGSRIQCENFNICLKYTPLSIWNNAFYVLQFCVPGSIIIFCTVCITWQLKTKTMDTTGKVRKAVQVIFIVATVFFICFLPSSSSRVASWVMEIWYDECSYFSDASTAFYMSICFTYLNCVLNPLIYYFSTPAFSSIINKFFRKLTGQKEKAAVGNTIAATIKSQ